MGREKILQKTKELLENGDELLALFVGGSRLYGLHTPKSDYDFVGIFKPSKDSLILKNSKTSYRFTTSSDATKNKEEDVDIQLSDIHGVLRRFLKADTTSIDILFAFTNPDAIIYLDKKFMEIVIGSILSQELRIARLDGILGYAVSQATKYGIKGTKLGDVIELEKFIEESGLPDDARVDDLIVLLEKKKPYFFGEDKYVRLTTSIVTVKGGMTEEQIALRVLDSTALGNHTIQTLKGILQRLQSKYGKRAYSAKDASGIDWKAVSHSFRVMYEMQDYISTGMVRFPFTGKKKEFIVQVKQGMIGKDEAFTILSDVYHEAIELEKGYKGISLDDGNKIVNDLILQLYAGA